MSETDLVAIDTTWYGKKKSIETNYGGGNSLTKSRNICCKSRNNVHLFYYKNLFGRKLSGMSVVVRAFLLVARHAI